MSNPKSTIFWMLVYLGVVAAVCGLLYEPLRGAFFANWVFNLLIVCELVGGLVESPPPGKGIISAGIQVGDLAQLRLFQEVFVIFGVQNRLLDLDVVFHGMLDAIFQRPGLLGLQGRKGK